MILNGDISVSGLPFTLPQHNRRKNKKTGPSTSMNSLPTRMSFYFRMLYSVCLMLPIKARLDAVQYLSNVQISKVEFLGGIRWRRKPQAPTPQAPVRNRQTRKVANAKGLNRNTNLA